MRADSGASGTNSSGAVPLLVITSSLPVVRVLVDGAVAREVRQEPAGFRVALPVPPAAYVCVVALNPGLGRPTPLGCVRGPTR